MAEDIRLAKGEEVDEIKAELALKANAADLEEGGYLKKKMVGALPTRQLIYDFENDKPIFTVPKIGSTVKGLSEIVTDTSGNKYHRICSTGAPGASLTIGSNSIVYSELDLTSVTANADNVIMEFDFMYAGNGRTRVSIGDLDILRTLTGTSKYETAGIAADIFSTSGNVFQINGSGSAHESFFGSWLHCHFEFDLSAKTVVYSVFSKDNTADSLSGTVDFRDSCDKITGISLYTWLAEDTVCFDNMEITSSLDEGIDEHTVYIIAENNAFTEYIYIDGKPICIGRSDVVKTLNDLIERIEALENK